MTDNETLEQMRDRWRDLWLIWRGRRAGDIKDQRTGDWIASRVDLAAGPDATVMCSTHGELEAELTRQGALAAAGAQTPTISAAFKD